MYKGFLFNWHTASHIPGPHIPIRLTSARFRCAFQADDATTRVHLRCACECEMDVCVVVCLGHFRAVQCRKRSCARNTHGEPVVASQTQVVKRRRDNLAGARSRRRGSLQARRRQRETPLLLSHAATTPHTHLLMMA